MAIGAYSISQITLPAGQWTPIFIPSPASYFSFKSQSNQPIRMRTNQADPATEDLLPGGYQEVLSTIPVGQNLTARWMPQRILFYAQPNSGSDVAILKWS